jgi:hypothetical protein
MKKTLEDLRRAAERSRDEIDREERERQAKLVKGNVESWSAWQDKINGDPPA